MRLFVPALQRLALGVILFSVFGESLMAQQYSQQAPVSKPFMAPSPYGNLQSSQARSVSPAQSYLQDQYSNQKGNPIQLGMPLHQSDSIQTAGWKQDITQNLPPLYSQKSKQQRNRFQKIRQVNSTEPSYFSEANQTYSDNLDFPSLETIPGPEMDYSESVEQLCAGNCWGWTVLPTDLLYTSYLAGPKEPRMGLAILHEKDIGWQMELEAGARVGILRYGSLNDEVLEGWQLDVEGAGPPRLNMENEMDLDAADFRVGVPLTWRCGAYQAKFAYYHTSAHVGDEFLARNPSFQRINYVRDAFVLGGGYFPNPDLRLYAEIGYAFNIDGGAKPWELQFGAEFSPAEHSGICGAPFWAVNGYLREEVDWGGNVNIMLGWQWRGDRNNHLFRIGLQYLDGKTIQYSFLNNSEQMFGFGTWYDF